MTTATFHKVHLVNWNSRTDDPPPDDGPGGPLIPGDDGYGRAASRQSLAIEAKIATCKNCAGIHHTQKCPEIAARLHAPEPWKDIALGRELCRMRWVNFSGFVTLLREVRGHGHLTTYAASYQAYIRDYSPDSTMSLDDVLAAWWRMMDGDLSRAA